MCVHVPIYVPWSCNRIFSGIWAAAFPLLQPLFDLKHARWDNMSKALGWWIHQKHSVWAAHSLCLSAPYNDTLRTFCQRMMRERPWHQKSAVGSLNRFHASVQPLLDFLISFSVWSYYNFDLDLWGGWGIGSCFSPWPSARETPCPTAPGEQLAFAAPTCTCSPLVVSFI